MKNILIVVDVQNGFTRYEQTRKVAEKIKILVDSELFDVTIATRFLNSAGSPFTQILNWHRLMNSPDIDLVEGLRTDYVVDKKVYTCVTPDFLNLLKKCNDGVLPEHIFIVGIDTDCCVLKTAVDAFEAGIRPIVLLEYCSSNGGDASHNAGALVMERLIGQNCLVSETINSRQALEEYAK